MNSKPWLLSVGQPIAAVGLLCVAVSLHAQEPAESRSADLSDSEASAADVGAAEQRHVSLTVARDRARLMHEIYVATLDVMHQRYFHGQRAIVPARAMEDIFAELKRQTDIEARWISVNVKAMSIHHEPSSEFEKTAAKELAAGNPDFEAIEDGVYRRAGAIALSGGCIGCHEGFGKKPTPGPKFAALTIAIPIDNGSASPAP